MVIIAIAGSTGEVAQEIIDALVATGKHEIRLLTRKLPDESMKDTSNLPEWVGTQWVQVDYRDEKNLIEALRGVEIVLSFVTPQTDPGNEAQLNLIDCSIAAGVKRFAPSEWATCSEGFMPWYAGKLEVRKYLEKVNTEKQSIEYTLFQPGLFLNYLTHPHSSAKHVHTFETQFDFANCRALVPNEPEKVIITLTTVQNVANIVAKAVEYDGVWPVIGGIKGCDVSIAELIGIGEDIRGTPFHVEQLDVGALRKGTEGDRWTGSIGTTWLPKVNHPAIPPDQADTLAEMLLVGMTLGMSTGALHVSAEWNERFPDYKFTQPKEFLISAWNGKP